MFLIIYRSIRVLYNLKINKLNIQNAEISINEGISKSILNNHIDEILVISSDNIISKIGS